MNHFFLYTNCFTSIVTLHQSRQGFKYFLAILANKFYNEYVDIKLQENGGKNYGI